MIKHRRWHTLFPVLVSLGGVACSSSSGGGGTADASHPDTSTADAKAKDSSTPDTSTHDGRASDAGGGTKDSGADAKQAPSDAASDGAFLTVDAAPPSMTVLPEAGTFLGAFVDNQATDAATAPSEQLFVASEQLIGRKWVIDNRFYDDFTDFVNDRTTWDIQHQVIPLVTWMPYSGIDNIIEGQRDTFLRAEADKAKALKVQILMRWGHEMNGNWYPWSGVLNNSDAGGSDASAIDASRGDAALDGGLPVSGPAKYIAAWRHVHDIFVQEGATNVVWVWCPNATDEPPTLTNHWTDFYPGDDYVDWVGIDAYNWGTSQTSSGTWATFSTLIFGSPYRDYAAKKPIMLPETASTEYGGSKAQWIQGMQQDIKTTYSGIRAVVWFDINKETDWQINSSPSALSAFEAMAQDPFFNPK